MDNTLKPTAALDAHPETQVAERVRRPPRRINTFRVVTYIVLTLAAVIYLMPFVVMITKSVMTFTEASGSAFLPPNGVHLQNYTEVWNDQYVDEDGQVQPGDHFWRYILTTALIEVLTVVGQTLVAILAAYGFARMKFPGRDLLFGMFLITIFVPTTVTLTPNFILVTRISNFFKAINPALQWTNNWPSLVIPFLASTFSIFLLRQFFRQIPDEIWEAARLDGASHLRFLFQFVVPLSRAAVLTVVLFAFLGVWNMLQWPLLVISDKNWWTIGVALQQYRAADGAQPQLLMAASVIALIPILIIYFFTQKQFTQGIATTGLKG
ncbi:MAG TPA: carbohydrate ABC transporter permease [Aggregatilineales bacterium]|nr:carbohydrate ABC transporter permease [Aggregatilineales bacterium]